ncbi:hypothetical protein ACN47E_007134 [Coniothyrium glycines]
MWEPFGTANATQKATWRPAPTERGTMSILSSCIITLLLCVYTCLHLNIPEHGKAEWYHLARMKLYWILLGIFAPEFVAYVAVNDWLKAKNLTARMGDLLENTATENSIQRASEHDAQIPLSNTPEFNDVSSIPTNHRKTHAEWTRTHSHYALMGGYVIDSSKSTLVTFPGGRTRLTLTPAGLQFLAIADPSLIPKISEADILDKSKADGFAKALACGQAIWFIAQFIGRLAADLPISLLELNTFLHAICCLVIYIAWWRKPFGIIQPSLMFVNDEDLPNTPWVWMLTRSNIFARKQLYVDGKESKKSMTIYLSHLPYSGIRELSHSNDDTLSMLRLMEGDYCHGFRFYDLRPKEEKDRYPGYCCLYPKDRQYLKLSHAFANANMSLMRLVENKNMNVTYISCFDERARTVPSDSNLDQLPETMSRYTGHGKDRGDSDTLFLYGLFATGAIYGAIHLLAWNGPFSTRSESILWKVAAFIITAPFVILLIKKPGILAVCYLLLRVRYPNETVSWQTVNQESFWRLPDNEGLWRKIWTRFLDLYEETAAYILAAPYILSRAYLVVECFINLAHLPDGVYHVAEWSQYLPHMGAG